MASMAPHFWLALLFFSSLGEVYFPDCMKLNGLSARTNWMFLAHAFGNAFVGTLPHEGPSHFRLSAVRAAAFPAIFDMASYAMLFGGMALAGAQTKSILYSSSILWSAILSKFVLGKVLATSQWLSIMLLVVGLLVKSAGGTGASTSSLSDASFLLGVGLILCGCFIHALANVINERIVRSGQATPKGLSCCIGFYGLTAWFGAYAMGYILPERIDGQWHFSHEALSWSALTQADAAVGVPLNSGLAWLAFVFMTTLHAAAFYSLLGSVGVVSSGIVKGMTTSSYVVLSSLSFCSLESHYCLNDRTILSSCICVTSVVCYSLATKASKEATSKAVTHEATSMSKETRLHPSNDEFPDIVEMFTELESTMQVTPMPEIRKTDSAPVRRSFLPKAVIGG